MLLYAQQISAHYTSWRWAGHILTDAGIDIPLYEVVPHRIGWNSLELVFVARTTRCSVNSMFRFVVIRLCVFGYWLGTLQSRGPK